MQEQTPENEIPKDLEQTQEQDLVQEEDTQQSQDLQAKYDELKDQYARAYADFENTKKRLEREKYQSLEYANERFGLDLLPVLDTLQKALESAKNAQADSTQNAIAEGLELTLETFYKALAKHGVEAIATDGEFDPNLHECLMQVKDETKQNGTIAQVLQNGYTYKQRLLRPAMVSIVKND
ncbi:nucleotide exchange factor GrpE [Helicobacter equorum]|uniref:nucleotide exchange factor GrpE n=1 Tax=Helicobacter equorum TaxID=361872 RepID=UPI000CF0BF51|nr:nucleotide exchange factor GrpE [Helicobacter equorum]